MSEISVSTNESGVYSCRKRKQNPINYGLFKLEPTIAGSPAINSEDKDAYAVGVDPPTSKKCKVVYPTNDVRCSQDIMLACFGEDGFGGKTLWEKIMFFDDCHMGVTPGPKEHQSCEYHNLSSIVSKPTPFKICDDIPMFDVVHARHPIKPFEENSPSFLPNPCPTDVSVMHNLTSLQKNCENSPQFSRVWNGPKRGISETLSRVIEMSGMPKMKASDAALPFSYSVKFIVKSTREGDAGVEYTVPVDHSFRKTFEDYAKRLAYHINQMFFTFENNVVGMVGVDDGKIIVANAQIGDINLDTRYREFSVEKCIDIPRKVLFKKRARSSINGLYRQWADFLGRDPDTLALIANNAILPRWGVICDSTIYNGGRVFSVLAYVLRGL